MISFMDAPAEGRLDEVNTDINTTITTTATDSETVQYDTYAKRILAHRSILGHILGRLLPVYQGMDPRQIAQLIASDIYVDEVPVEPGRTNQEIITDTGDRIVGFNTESKEINEGEVRFDLIFYAATPGGMARIIINLELQKDRPAQYPLLNRGLYYACRELASQKERDFKRRHYEQIKDTYSIWICMNQQEYSICDYHLTNDKVVGNAEWHTDLDLLHVIIIGITNVLPTAGEQKELFRLLCALYSNQLSIVKRLNILEKEYNIPITEEIGEEVDHMCNLGEGILERGIERGMAQGIAQGIERGIQQGISQGRRMQQENTICTMSEEGATPDLIARLLRLDLPTVQDVLSRRATTTNGQ